jgi:hypothetical protein
VEYISKSDAALFTYGTDPFIFNVQKKEIGNNLVTFSPRNIQQENCMWDLTRCSTGNNRKKNDL